MAIKMNLRHGCDFIQSSLMPKLPDLHCHKSSLSFNLLLHKLVLLQTRN